MTNENNRKSFDSGRFDFLGKAKILVPATVGLIVVGLAIMAVRGLNYGVDFAGGTEIQLKFATEVQPDNVRDFLSKEGYPQAVVQRLGDQNEFLIRLDSPKAATETETQTLINAMIKKVTDGLGTQFADSKPEIRRVDSVGPAVGEELKRNGMLAAFYSLLIILIYIGVRFDYKYAPGAVFCLFHDASIVLAIFAVLQKEVNVQTMAAILTLIGYSLNDTIVTFDRIRENEKLFPDATFYQIVNRSVNDTLSRTILTGFSTFTALMALYIFADGVIQDIAFTLAIGVVVGAYSTIYIAAPLVIAYDRFEAYQNNLRLKKSTTAKA
jgi:preprotein translocase subunit SecF